MRRLAGVALALGLLVAAPVPAQPLPQQVPIRLLDEDRLFRESRLGQQVLAHLRTAEEALERENTEIFDRLATEERALTEARATLTPEAFRARADAFDAQVEEIRAERAQRAMQLAQQTEAATQGFFQTALPVLVDVVTELGAVAVLKPDTLILGAEWLDITDAVIARLDAAHPGPAVD